MSKVIFRKASYDYKQLKTIIFEMIDSIGLDLSGRKKVIVKPNLLLPAKPEKAVLTHPFVVKAVSEYILSKGCTVRISDSPATGSFDKVIKEGGYKKVFDGLDVEFKEFTTSVKIDIGRPFGKIDIAKEVIDADVVINLAKLKTHAQMYLTLGVKNMFGCIVGLKKPNWHYRTGINREMFARLLVQIYNAVKPSITLIDGISAMEGQGPGKSGRPRHLGVLVCSKNAVAADIAICTMLGINSDKLPTNKEAKKLGLADDGINICGDFNMISDYKFPELGKLSFGPKPVNKLMRKYILQRPVADNYLCRLCGECGKYCPAGAITQGRKKINFDYETCIRCYCCVEICPHGALVAKETFLGKAMRGLFDV